MNAPNHPDDGFGEQQTGAGLIPLASLPLRLIAGFIENLRATGMLSESDAKRVLVRLGLGRV